MLWKRNPDWKNKSSSQESNENGKESVNFGRALGKSPFFAGVSYFLGATLYLWLGKGWLWHSIAVILGGFLLFWIWFFLFAIRNSRISQKD